MGRYSVFCALLLVFSRSIAQDHSEPVCMSRFDYEEKLLSKMIRMEMKMEKLEEKFMAQREQTIEEQKSFIETMETHKAKIDEMMESIQTRATDMEDWISLSISNITNTVNHGGVAFTAYQLHNRNVQSGEKLIFTKTTVNTRDVYNTETGIFTVPVAGVYLFNAQISHKGHRIGMDIVTGTGTIHRGYSYYPNPETTVSFTGVAVLSAGDQAWVKCFELYKQPSNIHYGILADDFYRRNSFTGVLIQEQI